MAATLWAHFILSYFSLILFIVWISCSVLQKDTLKNKRINFVDLFSVNSYIAIARLAVRLDLQMQRRTFHAYVCEYANFSKRKNRAKTKLTMNNIFILCKRRKQIENEYAYTYIYTNTTNGTGSIAIKN